MVRAKVRAKQCCGLRLVTSRRSGFSSPACKLVEFSLYRGATPRYISAAEDIRDLVLLAIPPRDVGSIEYLVFILVDKKQRVLCTVTGTSGEASSCSFDFNNVARLMNDRIESAGGNVGALYMGHNHPAGNATFSEDDIKTTKRIADLHKEMPWGLGDSIVVTKDRNYSSMMALSRSANILSQIKFRDV